MFPRNEKENYYNENIGRSMNFISTEKRLRPYSEFRIGTDSQNPCLKWFIPYMSNFNTESQVSKAVEWMMSTCWIFCLFIQLKQQLLTSTSKCYYYIQVKVSTSVSPIHSILISVYSSFLPSSSSFLSSLAFRNASWMAGSSGFTPGNDPNS